MRTHDRPAPEWPLMVRDGRYGRPSLPEYGRSGEFALDFQLRGYPEEVGYGLRFMGMTKVLDLHFLPSKGFRLDVHKTYKVKAYGWDPRLGEVSASGIRYFRMANGGGLPREGDPQGGRTVHGGGKRAVGGERVPVEEPHGHRQGGRGQLRLSVRRGQRHEEVREPAPAAWRCPSLW